MNTITMIKRVMPLLLLSGICLLIPEKTYAQGAAINTTGASADSSAMIDVSSNNKGALIPRMSESERNAIVNPAMGLLIFNTTTFCINVWVGYTWKQICAECAFSLPVVSNNSPICEGSTLNLSASNLPGASYAWTGPNGFSSTAQNPVISNTTISASGNYALTVTLNNCTSSAITTIVTVNLKPNPPAVSSNSPVCAGNNLDLTASSINGAVYSWSGPNGFSASQQNPSILNVSTAAAGTYSVIATVNSCSSNVATTLVAVNSTPSTPGAISGTSSLCSFSSGNVYTISAVPGATSYNWAVPAGATITSNTGTSITVTFGSSSGNITVAAANSCGSSGQSTLVITLSGAHGSQTFTANGSGASGSIQTFTVPACVASITIEAWGAAGGDATSYSKTGGLGARVRGTVAVTPGQVLKILVGQTPAGSGGTAGAGGGGSFVTDNSNNPLMIAGGGGGAATDDNGVAGTTANCGTADSRALGTGGCNGNGGTPCNTSIHNGGGGGGLLTNGGSSSNNGGGFAFVNGGGGGTGANVAGGYGGGGGASCCTVGGGGGGGYSGGAGGEHYSNCGSDNLRNGGGGGGSYNSGTSQSNSSGVQSGNGQVIITW